MFLFRLKTLMNDYPTVFVAYVFVTMLFLCAIAYCDPDWKDQRNWVFAILIATGAAWRLVKAKLAKTSNDYP